MCRCVLGEGGYFHSERETEIERGKEKKREREKNRERETDRQKEEVYGVKVFDYFMLIKVLTDIRGDV